MDGALGGPSEGRVPLGDGGPSGGCGPPGETDGALGGPSEGWSSPGDTVAFVKMSSGDKEERTRLVALGHLSSHPSVMSAR